MWLLVDNQLVIDIDSNLRIVYAISKLLYELNNQGRGITKLQPYLISSRQGKENALSAVQENALFSNHTMYVNVCSCSEFDVLLSM